ncbi:hypothetical protein DL89DRAFT_101374 [Linderina pennispora]|uniref:Uncharacterized protein n=1 Tax=Linderina pennispora TaxID=61395 RepID=A0A1Y1WE21_9FUNG|nr:uncharacterized protein DL89DRAFT_101374 [Linderina pennispora]ORX71779.1 hypothetical protein DL89DRAFT_101374 [Linderina pennispora]
MNEIAHLLLPFPEGCMPHAGADIERNFYYSWGCSDLAVAFWIQHWKGIQLIRCLAGVTPAVAAMVHSAIATAPCIRSPPRGTRLFRTSSTRQWASSLAPKWRHGQHSLRNLTPPSYVQAYVILLCVPPCMQPGRLPAAQQAPSIMSAAYFC